MSIGHVVLIFSRMAKTGFMPTNPDVIRAGVPCVPWGGVGQGDVLRGGLPGSAANQRIFFVPE